MTSTPLFTRDELAGAFRLIFLDPATAESVAAEWFEQIAGDDVDADGRFVYRDWRDTAAEADLISAGSPLHEWNAIMSRQLRYQVAVSLDGFIADPNGDYDWIVMDPSIDFAALFKEFDTAVMGRKTYEVLTAQGGHGALPGLDVVVFSRTLPAAALRGVRILNDDPREIVSALKAKPGRDIWLYGGGALFRSLLDAGLVDTVEVAVVPVLLGAGVPLLPPGAATKLVLADQKTLPVSGIVALAYSVPGGVGPAPRIRYVKPAKTRAKKGASTVKSIPDPATPSAE